MSCDTGDPNSFVSDESFFMLTEVGKVTNKENFVVGVFEPVCPSESEPARQARWTIDYRV